MNQSYSNTVYNLKNSSVTNNNDKTTSNNVNENLNQSKELKEINSRLGFYINALNNTNQNQTTTNSIWLSNTLPNSNSLIVSMKNLERDLEQLKQIYDEEIKLMKYEIEELSIVKNKYSLENFNLELKLKDFVVKFEDVKKSNQELANELNDIKSKNNRLEFEIENYKLEAEKPIRENNQLKKDLEDLINKLNEKQELADHEITYRQELEGKLKELKESFLFEKKVAEQEIENFKSQSKLFQDTISELEKKLSDSLNKEIEYNRIISNLESDNSHLRSENRQLEDQNESLKIMCKNLESVISNLETMKKSLEEKIILNERKNQNVLNSEICSIKSKLEAEEVRLLQLVSKNQQQQQQQVERETLSRYSFTPSIQDDYIEMKQHNEALVRDRSNFVKSKPLEQITNIQNQLKQTHNQIKPYLNSSKSPEQISARLTLNNSQQSELNYISNLSRQSVNELENPLFTKTFQPSEYASSPACNYQSYQQNLLTNNLQNVNVNTANLNRTKSNEFKANNININKDITNDLFNTFEKEILLNQNNSCKKEINNSSVSSIDNHTVTEASYVGNVKIHEINKNGYYVRLINVSNMYEEDLSNYTIQQMVSAMPVAVFRLPSSTKLAPGHTITVWAKTDEVEQQPPHTFVWHEQEKWGTGPECTTILTKPNGQAVSWTTGCHKYGNIDYDEIVPVYSHKRNKSTVQLDRTKLIPQKIFAPTKHPHGSSSRLSTVDFIESQNNTKNQSENNGFQKSFFTAQKSRPINSELSNKSNQRPQSSLSVSSGKTACVKNINNDTKTDFTYQENISYFHRAQPSPHFINRVK